eukprot:COSAG01_NODE_47533_length_389_cov_1.100000_1_plen_89_part_01
MHAQSTWIRCDDYELGRVLEVRENHNSRLRQRYEGYKRALPEDVINGHEQMYFHGCAESAIESSAYGLSLIVLGGCFSRLRFLTSVSAY